MKRISLLLVLLVACSTDLDLTTTVTNEAVTTTAPATTVPATTGGSTSGDGVTVSASDFSFGPSTVTIKVGETVTWTLAEGAHTTTSGVAPDQDGLWNQALTADSSFTFTFDEAGTFPYFCRFHADFMSGVVTVEP